MSASGARNWLALVHAKDNLGTAVEKINANGKEAIISFAKGDEQKVMLMGLKRFTKMDLYNVKDLRQEIADYLIEKNEYAF